MLKLMSAIVAAALIAAAVASFAPSSSADAGTPERGRKGDRLDRVAAPEAPACVERGWPYHGYGCRARSAIELPPPVRLVSTDRL